MGASGLGTLLVKEGLLTEQDRLTIGRTSGQSSWAFAKGVIAMGLLDEDELAAFLAERTNHRVAAKDIFSETKPEALAALEAHMFERLEVLPIDLNGNTLTVAMADPLDKGILRQLEFFTGRKVNPVIASFSQIYAGLKKINPDFEPVRSPLEYFLNNHASAASRRQKLSEITLSPRSGRGRSTLAQSADDDHLSFMPAKAKAPPASAAESADEVFDDIDLDNDLDSDLAMAIDDTDVNLDALEALDGDTANLGDSDEQSGAAAMGDLDDLAAEDGADLATDSQVPLDFDLDPASQTVAKTEDEVLSESEDAVANATATTADPLADLGGLDDVLGAEPVSGDVDLSASPAGDPELASAATDLDDLSVLEADASPTDADLADLALDDPAADAGLDADLAGVDAAVESGDLDNMSLDAISALDTKAEGDLDAAHGDGVAEEPMPVATGDDASASANEPEIDDDLLAGIAGDDEIEAIGDTDLLGDLASSEPGQDDDLGYLSALQDDSGRPDVTTSATTSEDDPEREDETESLLSDDSRREDDTESLLSDDLDLELEGETESLLSDDLDPEDELGNEPLQAAGDDFLDEGEAPLPASADPLAEDDSLLTDIHQGATTSSVTTARHDTQIADLNQAMIKISMASSAEKAIQVAMTALAPALPFAVALGIDAKAEAHAVFGWESGDDDDIHLLGSELNQFSDDALKAIAKAARSDTASFVKAEGRIAEWLHPVTEIIALKSVDAAGVGLALVGACETGYRDLAVFHETAVELLKILSGKVKQGP